MSITSAPVIFFQGAEDRVVPSNQTELMVAALKKRGVPVGYFLFDRRAARFPEGREHKACARRGALFLRDADSALRAPVLMFALCAQEGWAGAFMPPLVLKTDCTQRILRLQPKTASSRFPPVPHSRS
jgi:hypothetical protein